MINTHLPLSILCYAKQSEPDVLGQEAQQNIQTFYKNRSKIFLGIT